MRVSFNHSCGPREEERLRGIDLAYSGLISTEVGQGDRPCRCQDRSERATGHGPPLLPGNRCATLTSRQRPRALRIPKGGGGVASSRFRSELRLDCQWGLRTCGLPLGTIPPPAWVACLTSHPGFLPRPCSGLVGIRSSAVGGGCAPVVQPGGTAQAEKCSSS